MKYNNEKVSVNGEVFDSKLEFYRYQQLKILERARARATTPTFALSAKQNLTC